MRGEDPQGRSRLPVRGFHFRRREDFRAADQCDRKSREDERKRIEKDRPRSGEHLNEDASESGADDLRGGKADGELPVALEPLFLWQKAGQVSLVGDVKEHGEEGGGDSNTHQEGERELAVEVSPRDGGEDKGAGKVGCNQDGAMVIPVGGETGKRPGGEGGDALQGGEQTHLGRARIEQLDGSVGQPFARNA